MTVDESFFTAMRRKALGAVAAAAALTCAFAAPAQAQTVIGLTTTNALVAFDAATPGNASAGAFISGLDGANERILAIDVRPTNGLLYGISSDSKLYTLDAATGVATKIGTIGVALNGSSFGLDFNPVADLNGAASLRVTSNTGQNLAVNANTGAATMQTGLTYNGASIGATAAAYKDNDADPATTAVGLYYIDTVSDSLYLTSAPAAGVLSFVGGLGFDSIGVIGFDIAGVDNMAYAGLTSGDTGKTGLYSINLGTGAATLIGAFGIGGNVANAPPLLGLTVAAVPEPETYALMLAGLLALGWTARRRNRH